MRASRLAVAALLMALAACNGILPKPKPPPALFRLTPLGVSAAPGRPIEAQLAVDLPEASAALDTERIALTRGPLSVDYFADAAWTDHAPAMLQTLLIQSLQDAGQVRVVAGPSGQLRADAVLACDLHRFEARYDGAGPPEIDVQLQCRVVAMPDRGVLAVRGFEGTSRAAANDMPQIVAGFDAAMHDAIGPLLPWVAQSLAAMKR